MNYIALQRQEQGAFKIKTRNMFQTSFSSLRYPDHSSIGRNSYKNIRVEVV